MSRSIWSAVATLLSPIAISSLAAPRLHELLVVDVVAALDGALAAADVVLLLLVMRSYILRLRVEVASREVALNSRGRSCVSVMLFRKVSR